MLPFPVRNAPSGSSCNQRADVEKRNELVKAVKFAVLLGASMAVSAAMAQSTPSAAPNQAGIDSDITLLRSDLQTQRTAVVTDEMKLTDEQGKAFWPLYREYANKQQVIGDQRVSLIKDYATSYNTMDDTIADGLIKRQLKFEEDRVKLQSGYYPKFKKAVGAKASRKVPADRQRLNMLVDLQLAASIPVLQ